MNPVLFAARLGVVRGWAEFRQIVTSPQDMGSNVFWAAAYVLVVFFQRGSTVEGTSMSLAMATLPSVLGMSVAWGGLMGAAGYLTVEREDGTLLRAKAVPHGMVGYLIGRVVSVSLTVLSVLIILIPGLFLVPELAAAGLAGWLTLAWVIALGLLALLPWRAVIGSLAKSPAALFGMLMIPVIGVVGISGIFYPISALAGWVQGVAQVFPVYWLGLGARSALMPEAAAVVEISQSWRHLETVGVLGVWAVAGLLLAPVILRRMARRESGSLMQERREQAMQRFG